MQSNFCKSKGFCCSHYFVCLSIGVTSLIITRQRELGQCNCLIIKSYIVDLKTFLKVMVILDLMLFSQYRRIQTIYWQLHFSLLKYSPSGSDPSLTCNVGILIGIQFINFLYFQRLRDYSLLNHMKSVIGDYINLHALQP